MLPVTLSGTVKQFTGDGRRLGYPTANLVQKTELKDGVYFGFADLRRFLNQPAVIFIGVPTTMGKTKRRIEAYLLDIPDVDYYGEKLTLRLCHYHRPNQTFPSSQALIVAMQDDEQAAREWSVRNSFAAQGRVDNT